MPEFLELKPPHEALETLMHHIPPIDHERGEQILTENA